MDIEKIEQLMRDEAFAKRLLTMEDNTAVQKAFAEEGVDLTLEQINRIAETVYGSSGELDEGQLETVAGGFMEELGIVLSGIKLISSALAEYNKSRKAKGKSSIW